MEIYYDGLQEGVWFQSLHPNLNNAKLLPFPTGQAGPEGVRTALFYDRPDIILADNDKPILIFERTIEVPSGHNVGQRFARLAAAAQMKVPAVYFGPYAAYKHGGNTQGPRYMNLRLFYALNKLEEIEETAITTINWPVDQNYEVVQTPQKDHRVIAYLKLFFDLYAKYGLPDMLYHLRNSTFEQEQKQEQKDFIQKQVKRPEQYDNPPDSVGILHQSSLSNLFSINLTDLTEEVVLYKVGMNYIRSDPYTGTAMLYAYLYCGGMKQRTRSLLLHFPNITLEMWKKASKGQRSRKDIRLFRIVADGICFSDGYLGRSSL